MTTSSHDIHTPVFIASPGDTGLYRDTLKAEIDRFSATETRYKAIGWESVPPSARRAQDAINDLIHTAHFAIILFNREWGSHPGGEGYYSSGTEEELFTALADIYDPSKPMRDVAMIFVDTNNAADEVKDFKQRVIESRSILFSTVSTTDDLRHAIRRRLSTWEGVVARGSKIVSLTTSLGTDVLTPVRRQLEATTLIDTGEVSQGLQLLKSAAESGFFAQKLEYIKQLMRASQHNEAQLELDNTRNDLIHSGLTHSPQMAELLGQHGLICRSSNQSERALHFFESAKRMANEVGADYRITSRICDYTGIQNQKRSRFDIAELNFAESLNLRESHGTTTEIAQSKINIARNHASAKRYDDALAISREVVEILASEPPSHVKANAYLLAAQNELRANRHDSAYDHARSALEFNVICGFMNGMALSNFVCGQASKAKGDLEAAVQHLSESLELNQSMSNEYGEERAGKLLRSIQDENSPHHA